MPAKPDVHLASVHSIGHFRACHVNRTVKQQAWVLRACGLPPVEIARILGITSSQASYADRVLQGNVERQFRRLLFYHRAAATARSMGLPPPKDETGPGDSYTGHW